MRLTGKRCSGIRSGYWSQAKKDELVQRLGKYEDLGEPEELKELLTWHDAGTEQPDDPEEAVLVEATGKAAENIIFRRAVVIGFYDSESREWILDGWPEAECEVERWREI